MPDTSSAQLLWEVGCEELPAWACEQVLTQLQPLLEEELRTARIDTGTDVQVWVGPRRFAVSTVIEREQRAAKEEARGPAYDAAFKDGVATKAVEGFARSKGMTPDQLEVREQDGKKFMWAVREAPQEPLSVIFADIAQRIVSKLNFGKAMRWGTGEHRFVRPIRWIVTRVGVETLDYELFGVRSGTTTRSHRFLGDEREVALRDPANYLSELSDAWVVADHTKRRTDIEAALDAEAAAYGGKWTDPARVLNEVVHLVEFPTVIVGHFDESYLQLPERVLVTAMQSHQRYLPISDDKGLRPAFLAVMNGDPKATDNIRPGYERVLAGRLDDAVFSFDRDRARGLDDMASSLGAVVFHAKAGSMADRSERIRGIAANLAEQTGADAETVDTAARLAKADQVSVLVQEFAELEGFAGSLYARDAGYDEEVARAIDQQFRPRSATAPLPDAGVSALVALADKFDLLVTAYSIGEQPTGSRDPHGLRRAAIGVVRIVLDHDLPIDVCAALAAAGQQVHSQGYGDPMPELLADLHAFIVDRLEKNLTDDGVRVDAVRAARAAKLPQLQHVQGLARSLDKAARTDDAQFRAVLTALVRCTRILAKADPAEAGSAVDAGVFEADIERVLHEQLVTVAQPIMDAVHGEQYDEAVAQAATLGPAVDAFFERETGVMVMADEPKLRANRLALVKEVIDTLAPLGELTQLQVG